MVFWWQKAMRKPSFFSHFYIKKAYLNKKDKKEIFMCALPQKLLMRKKGKNVV